MATADQWLERVREWKASGLTASEFSARRGLKAKQLNTWAWKLGKTSKEEGSPVEAPVQFVKLVPQRRPDTKVADRIDRKSCGVRIVAGGVVVEVQSGFDHGVLLEVLNALAERREIQR